MLMRQDSTLLSSSRRESTPPPENRHHAKAVGCMSGIFKLISNYQNRHKLLTFGRKHEKKAVSSPKKANDDFVTAAGQELSSSVKEENKKASNVLNSDTKRSSSDMMTRSPMLSPKIRRPNTVDLPDNNIRPRSALVARLMGLEDQQPVVGRKRMVEQESTEEKRQRLLQALEKCNEDLEALKDIIKAVQSAEMRAPLVNEVKENIAVNMCTKRFVDEKSEQLSPVCVLDQRSPSPLSNYCSITHANIGIMPQQCRRMLGKKPGEDDAISVCFFNKILTESFRMKRKPSAPSFWSSKAMIQSVDEVCNDIVWGEKREIQNIGQVLQNHICKDLIEEIVKEFGNKIMHPLPFEACKKRLSF